MIKYGFIKEFSLPFTEVREKVIENLKIEGFGILTEIDVQAKLKEKLGIDFRQYIILGACNPAYAHKAIGMEENIGLMLPCNIIIYEKENKTILSIIKPTVMMEMTGNEKLLHIAQDVESKLQRVISATA